MSKINGLPDNTCRPPLVLRSREREKVAGWPDEGRREKTNSRGGWPYLALDADHRPQTRPEYHEIQRSVSPPRNKKQGGYKKIVFKA